MKMTEPRWAPWTDAPPDVDAALATIATSLFDWNKPQQTDSPIYLSDASTRAASTHRPQPDVSVDALIQELVNKRDTNNKYTAAASVCRSTFFERQDSNSNYVGCASFAGHESQLSIQGLEWTPPPPSSGSTHILTMEGGLYPTQGVAKGPLRTRTLSHSSSPLLPGNESFTLRDGRVAAASYHGTRRVIEAFQQRSASALEGSVLSEIRPDGGGGGVTPPDESKEQLTADENLSAMRELKLEALLEAFNLTLGQTRNAVLHLPECVRMILPISPEGETLSVGSLLHYSGGCRNCIFNSGRQGCHNGLNCVFCHHAHPRPKRRSRKRVSKTQPAPAEQ
eukprot:Protomagalhaensia_sp_Gyna_25__5477@NODE_725_length_2763_cov_12_381791_g565_i0_p1_GENE_NODE_725_length_2763_cov_12_381791_g565_i0NODE_725_length_2763_cov_12_381791_g565_i0_p1_ORF_typecomplete_len338_score35_79_NODE_725_length_2763_cov_12_381791_g565_i0431056